MRGNSRAIRVGLLAISLALAAQAFAAVTAKVEPLTLPYWTAQANWQVNPNHLKPYSPVADTKKLEGDRTLETVVLENEYLRVQAVPELGGVIARAIYKPTGDDLFFYEGKLKSWLPWWESGVKMSFPYYEHGLGTAQPAGYRIVNNADGSVTLAMWMEFSRFTEGFQRRRYGRFSNMLFTELVTLRPGEDRFSMTFRIVNPGPWKQGRRLWTDTLLPRNQTKDGVVQGEATPPVPSTTEWVFPAAYASDHGGWQAGPYDSANDKIGKRTAGPYSVFAWDMPYGFAGLYYPEVQVNRLRLWDPAVAPGAKQWYMGDGKWDPKAPNHMYNFCELWGGSDDVFEGVENWIGPGETYQFTYDYTLLKGLGKAEWADSNVALQSDFAADKPSLKVITLRRVAKLAATLDGKPLGELPCAPDAPATFPVPAGTKAGRLVLTADGVAVFDRQLPIEIPLRTAKHDLIKGAMVNSAQRAELLGNADEQGNTYQSAIAGYPAESTARGRVLLRHGDLDAAVACLKAAAVKEPGEANYLLGVALLEQGDAASAKAALEQAAPAYPAAQYYLAVVALGAGDRNAAGRAVTALLAAIPGHWEGRLLQAWLEATAPTRKPATPRLALAMAAEDPADPRVQAILAATGDATAREALDALQREPGAKARLEEFRLLTTGKYPIPTRLAR